MARMQTDLQRALTRLETGNPELFKDIKGTEQKRLELIMSRVSYPVNKLANKFPESIRMHVAALRYKVAAEWAPSEVLEDLIKWVETRAYDDPAQPWPRADLGGTLYTPVQPDQEVDAVVNELAGELSGELSIDEQAGKSYKGWGSW